MSERLRTVDSWTQLVDRLIICRLKQWHYDRDQRHEEAQHAKDQGDELSEAAEMYLQECLRGDREPRVHQHLRYHRHDAEEVHPSSVMDAVSRLATCHAEYWHHQGAILDMRRCIDALGSSHKDKEYRSRIIADVEIEQRSCDRNNQLRNELIQKGDDLLRRMWERRASNHGGRVFCEWTSGTTPCPNYATGFVHGGQTPLCEDHIKEFNRISVEMRG